jgi:hypothetical protein
MSVSPAPLNSSVRKRWPKSGRLPRVDPAEEGNKAGRPRFFRQLNPNHRCSAKMNVKISDPELNVVSSLGTADESIGH